MFKAGRILFLVLIIVGVLSLVATAGAPVNQTAAIGGTVVGNGLASAGTRVNEGDVLVMVTTISGAAPAARANTGGIVTEVLVSPGQNISAGQLVARIVP